MSTGIAPRPGVGRHLLRALAGLLLCALAGCVDRSNDGKTSVYSFALWAIGIFALLGLGLIGVGVLTLKRQRWGAILTMVLGVVAIIAAVGMMRLDRVVVDDEHFESSHGLPWDRVSHNHRFDELREIRVEVKETKSRSGTTKRNYTLLCQSKAGGVDRVPIGTVMEKAVSEILDLARKKGVPIIGVDELPLPLRP